MKDLDIYGLDGRQLKLFLCVFDTVSVSRAADQLGITQSTASHGLERLRKALGDPLFVKSGRGIAPTDTAKELAPRVRAVLIGLEGLRTSATYDPAQDTGAFRIATNVTEILPKLIEIKARICKAAPHVTIHFHDMGSRVNAGELLSAGAADLVIAVSLPSYPSLLLAERLYSDRSVCYYCPKQRGPVESVEDFVEAKHAALDFGASIKSSVGQELERQGIIRRIRMTAPNSHTLAELMRDSDYVATMPLRLHKTVFKDFSYSTPPMALPPITHDMLWHVRNDNAARNSWLREVVRSTR
ncbi:LysR family transcriptional regulator [Dinoroseobacter sp. PD6]|uniref:LysR family transcriptional regulator n=1 Tax=Dinoroseobacter sp. PD6 TaxID=3028384 RepID=UPI00237A25F0|nr:LysR family transcriptional regulator [Dinoroseobacter sp. PD6]MDD9716404.1 LysR family transcriptional regulator [Dinoroseobacter sp. PD6]